MKSNSYYVGILAAALLVVNGPASFATSIDPTQLTETTDQTETSPDGIVTVAIGEGSNETIQHYTYDPQTVEINAGESVTWFTPAEFPDLHTVTFVQDPSIVSDILLPFAVPAGGGATDFELLPPFNTGEPVIIPTPDGREAIVALNKHGWYPAVVGANNQTTYLEGTDIQATLNSTVRALNSGIILPPMPPTGEAQPNSTETGTAGEQQLGPPFPIVSSFTVTFEEPGTYPYFCAIHPWMTGQVVVSGDIPAETQGQNQTETETQAPAAQTERQAQNELEAANPIFE